MDDFEPIKKTNYFKNNSKKYIYISALLLVFLLGTSYSLTFFVQNKKVVKEP